MRGWTQADRARLRATQETSREASLDGDDMRRAEGAELRCAAVGCGPVGGWPVAAARVRSAHAHGAVHRRYGELMVAPIRPMPRLESRVNGELTGRGTDLPVASSHVRCPALE